MFLHAHHRFTMQQVNARLAEWVIAVGAIMMQLCPPIAAEDLITAIKIQIPVYYAKDWSSQPVPSWDWHSSFSWWSWWWCAIFGVSKGEWRKPHTISRYCSQANNNFAGTSKLKIFSPSTINTLWMGHSHPPQTSSHFMSKIGQILNESKWTCTALREKSSHRTDLDPIFYNYFSIVINLMIINLIICHFWINENVK